MKRTLAFLASCLVLPLAHAGMTVTPWIPIFKGVDRAAGTNTPDATIPRLQAANCVRVDLTDPDVRLFPTPPATNYQAGYRETLSLTVSNFLKIHRLQVASDANFYRANPGAGDPSSEGVPTDVYGLQICTGAVVSIPNNADAEPRFCSLLFATNNEPFFAFNNRPPGTNTTGIYSAVTGYYPVLTNGAIVGAAYLAANYPDNTIHNPQPRTVFGVSQDSRYLFLVNIDGRQGGYSDGATDQESAMWLIRFGAWNAINMDGGGSAAMYMADCKGNPIPLGHSSYVAQRNRERYVGSHLGVFARPLAPIYDVTSVPGAYDAVVTWKTPAEMTSQVDYGTTPGNYTSSAFDPVLVTNHSVTLTDLTPATNYYLRITSSNATDVAVEEGCSQFRTANPPGSVEATLFYYSKPWRYSTANLDGINWKARTYDDSAWPVGPGVLWADSRSSPPNPIPEKRTQMPIDPVSTYAYVTYYFRTTFLYTDRLAGVTLRLTNLLDDGAVFYLNGGELQRAFMPDSPTAILNSTVATGYPCGGDATCPYLVTITGSLAANLIVGTNVLAVEAHNFRTNSPDVTFGASLAYSLPPPPPPEPPFMTNLNVLPGETSATITWTTRSNATTQVEYGLTPSLGLFSPLDSSPTNQHTVTLSNLAKLTPYYFRAISTVGSTTYDASGTFTTVPFYQEVVALTNTWKFSTANLDGTNWTATDFDDSTWPGGPALLFVDLDPNPNPAVQPKYTVMPANQTVGQPFTTYYFRTRFNAAQPGSGFSLVLSNFVDDGAVFYLNGAEIQRLRMPASPAIISNATLATEQPFTNDAVFADVFRLSGDSLTNLVADANVLAVEVHNYSDASPDVTFGSSIGWVRAVVTETRLSVGSTDNTVCLSWEGTGFTLERSRSLGSDASWEDVPGPVTTSPYCVPNPGETMFYRLR